MDFKKAREEMVKNQIIARGITDDRVINAMFEVPREKFVGDQFKNNAYEDHPLPIAEGQTISQPYIVALMTQALKLSGKEKVLEIGTGSGYQLAILSRMVKEVYSIERIGSLAEKARQALKELNYNNTHIFTGDGSLGLKDFAPYDRIIVTASSPDVPQALLGQLNDEGIIVIPTGPREIQELQIIQKKGDKVITKSGGGCFFVPLIGKHGWQPDKL